MKRIELLSPAKNLSCGLEAVKHGADAVYIGAPRYGARVAAANRWDEVETLVRFAHLYSAKVYVTLNTILNDRELEEAVKMAWQAYNVGVDALIIQDMGLLRTDLPPIALHASTQTDNRTPEKVLFLQNVGFQRVILARELSLSQICAIRKATGVELEAFVHGALCVSYSGQCYMSYAGSGRSANRGACAQYCRLPYTLTDADGKLLQKEAHLLSLKDMNRSEYLQEMLNAGITSFKIEGRLKDEDYVKNITLHYRRRLDAVLEGKECFGPASVGKVTAFFEPNPEKTFYRGGTDYFLHNRRGDEHQWSTPKSLGEPLGTVSHVFKNGFQIDTDKILHNGDGLCFLNKDHQLVGFRLNVVKEKFLYPLEMPAGLLVGTMVYRNEDRLFSKQLEGESAKRKIMADLLFQERETGFSLTLTDEEGLQASSVISMEKQPAQNAMQAEANIRQQLSKMGDSPFVARNIVLDCKQIYFVPVSLLNRLRREAVAGLQLLRESRKPKAVCRKEGNMYYPFSLDHLDYTGNVLNSSAAKFYRDHGVVSVDPALEGDGMEAATKPLLLMKCKYCIRNAMHACKRKFPNVRLNEPLYLQSGANRYKLKFDCDQCEMQIWSV